MLISFIDLARLVDDAGFPAGTSQATGLAIVTAESGRDPSAKYVNDDGSIDRGLWQINGKWHPEVTDAQAYDPVTATAAALKISNGGTNYSPWATFNNGAYKVHLEAAKVALDGWARVKTLNKTVTGLNATVSALQAQVATIQNQLDASWAQSALLQDQLTAAQTKLGSEVDLVTKLQAAAKSAEQILAAALSS